SIRPTVSDSAAIVIKIGAVPTTGNNWCRSAVLNQFWSRQLGQGVRYGSTSTSVRAQRPSPPTSRNGRRVGNPMTWRVGIRRGRASQALGLDEGKLRARTTANSLTSDHHGPLQDDQAVKTKPSWGAACGFWVSAWGQREPAV